MTFSSVRISEGWLRGHPSLFLLAFLAIACSQTPAPAPRAVPVATCEVPALRTSTRFTFRSVESGLPKSGQWRDGFDLADMNGDGDVDLVHGPSRKGTSRPVIFLGNGFGQFVRWNTARFPDLPYDYGDAKAADFNRDGLMDLALSSHLRGLTVLLHEGEGQYSAAANGLDLRLPSGDDPPFASRAIVLTDWNGDGLRDLLALNEGPVRRAPTRPDETLALFLNRNGLWQRVPSPGPVGVFGTAIAAGDVDGDGDRDALIGTSVSGVRALLQIGDGRSWTSHELQSLPANAQVTAVAMSDLDGDRRDEIFDATLGAFEQSACVTLDLVRYRDGRDEAQRLFAERARNPIMSILTADLDGDRRNDVVALRRSGAMLVFAGTADGLARDADVPAPHAMEGCDAFEAHAADLDRDGTQEVIVNFAGDLTTGGSTPCPSGGGFVVWRLE
ncbi:MAG TPA: VCBS repeat-containing protein [Thermoanaerobaculia bacterium]|jgi:hypothetical protein|nr:VCBS repeat-containing protein [Thermoanaerobaculia bacterium]